jgi:hypothetical protein
MGEVKNAKGEVYCEYSSQKNFFKMDGFPVLKGPLGDLAINFMENAMRPHPISAFISALMMGAAITSRNFDFEGSYANLFTVIFGKTGIGKNDLLLVPRNWNQQIACKGLILEASSFTSSTAVHSAVALQPQTLMMWDEFGRVLTNLSNSEMGGDVSNELTTLYTSCGTISAPKTYAMPTIQKKDNPSDGAVDLRKVTIKRPALSLLGFGTPTQMDGIFTEENFESGDLSRFLVFYIPDECVEYEKLNTKLPQRCLDFIRNIFKSTGATTLSKSDTVNVEPILNGCVDENWCIQTRDYSNPKDAITCYYEESKDFLKKLDLEFQKQAILETDISKRALKTRELDKIKKISIIFSLLNRDYDDILDFVEWEGGKGHCIRKEDFLNAERVVRKSTKVLDKYEYEKHEFPPRIEKSADEIAKLVDEFVSTTRHEISQHNIKIRPNDWILVEACLENKGICVERYANNSRKTYSRFGTVKSNKDESSVKSDVYKNNSKNESAKLNLNFNTEDFGEKTNPELGKKILELRFLPLPLKNHTKVLTPDSAEGKIKYIESEEELETDFDPIERLNDLLLKKRGEQK